MADKAQEARRQDYQEVFGTIAGQRVLGDLMRSHHMYTTVYHGNTNETMFAEGERNAILYILYQMKETADQVKFRAREQQAEHDYSPTS